MGVLPSCVDACLRDMCRSYGSSLAADQVTRGFVLALKSGNFGADDYFARAAEILAQGAE